MRNIYDTFFFNSRLVDGLNNIYKMPLTVISAQIGAGKTTAVRAFLNRVRTTVLWHSYHKTSSKEYWREFCSLIGSVNEECGRQMTELGEKIPQEEEKNWMLVQILSKLSENGLITYVIDNYYELQEQNFREFIGYLAKQQIKNFYIIIISRESFVSSFELILNGNINYMYNDVFMLTKEEIRKYYDKIGISLSEWELLEVMKYSEGWLPVLGKVAGEIQKSNSKKVIEHIDIYLEDLKNAMKMYMKGKLSPSVKRLLLGMCNCGDIPISKISLFAKEVYPEKKSCNDSLKNDIKESLENLCKKNMFINYDGHSQIYHIHYLFKKILQEEFKRLPENVQQKFCKVLISKVNKEMVWESAYKNSFETIVFLKALEAYDYQTDSFSDLLYIAFQFLLRNEKRLFHKAEKVCEKFYLSGREVKQQERIQYNFIKIYGRKQQKIEELFQHWRDSIKILLLKQGEITENLFDYTFGSLLVGMWYFYEEGTMDEVVENIKLIGEEAERIDFYKCLYFVLKGELHLQRFELNEAEICIYATENLVKHENGKEGISLANFFLNAGVLCLNGKVEEALNLLEEKQEYFVRNGMDCLANALNIGKLWIKMCVVGCYDEKTKLEYEVIQHNSRELAGDAKLKYLIEGKNLILNKQYTVFLGKYMGRESNEKLDIYSEIYIALFSTVAYRELGQQEKMYLCLKEAIKKAIPDCIYLPFIIMYNELWQIYRNLEQNTDKKYVSFIAQVLKYSDIYNKNLGVSYSKVRIDQNKLLTSREKEIAVCVHQGMTNKEVASHLMISENTVKSALKSIFKKMNISSRKELLE